MKVISPFKGKAAAFTNNHRISTIHYAARPFWAHLLPKLSAGICMEYHRADSDANG